jgi:CheY-like chemotaxis protein
MHAGGLSVESEGVGCGSRFILSLGFIAESNLLTEAKEEETHSLQGMDVLIVEDSEDTLLLLGTMFSHEGATVTTASSADEALAAVATKRPTLIVSDIGMPDTDGYQFLQQVKDLPGMKEVPAIAISGYASEEDRARALEVGYLALVPKPIDIDELFSLINSLKQPVVSAQ